MQVNTITMLGKSRENSAAITPFNGLLTGLRQVFRKGGIAEGKDQFFLIKEKGPAMAIWLCF
jgi:hypothetical protein